jgi:hypothetical protein
MYLKCHRRFKDGKEHRYWSIAEKRRVSARRTVDRHVLYLGEINDSQRAAWLKSIEAFDETRGSQRKLALFPADRAVPEHAEEYGVQVKLKEFTLRRPRQWGACWAFCRLWALLGMEEFWQPRLADSREGTSWYHVLMLQVAYRLIDPGSEWRLHRQWYERSAMADLLGEGPELAAKDTLYRCLDRLLPHKDALQLYLKDRWQDLFGASFDVLLYDLTSTYFESDPPFEEEDKRRFGYSRDHRFDCVQVVIALIVTPEGLPLTYEVLSGNTADATTLPQFLERIEKLYGSARRIWVMDRGIPTEAHLELMRARGAQYLVGTPKGRLNKLEAALAARAWHAARPEVRVKLLPRTGICMSTSRVRRASARSARCAASVSNAIGHGSKSCSASARATPRLLMKLGAAAHDAGRTARSSKSPCPRHRRRVSARSAWILPSPSIAQRSKKSAAAKVATSCART